MRSKSRIILGAFFWIFLVSCSSGPEVKRQEYAELRSHRTYEHEMNVVWKSLENALESHKIVERDADGPLERKLVTDWIYSQSRDKYQEYRVNNFPRKKYLQVRFRYVIYAKQVIGGTDLRVNLEEEIERLNEDGTSAGFSKSTELDSSRPNDLLDRVQQKILLNISQIDGFLPNT